MSTVSRRRLHEESLQFGSSGRLKPALEVPVKKGKPWGALLVIGLFIVCMYSVLHGIAKPDAGAPDHPPTVAVK